MIKISANTGYNVQKRLIEDYYKKSQEVVYDTINSAHSKTLDELYTDEFRPSKLKSNQTTVKSIETGKPVVADLKCFFLKDESDKTEQKFQYELQANSKILGRKIFGFSKGYDEKNEFEPGYIESFQNKKYAGTQIRLLQASLEQAQKKDIKSVPLFALLPAVKFHTMMGFKPSVSLNKEVQSISDVANELGQCIEKNKHYCNETDFFPILTKCDNDTYFFDKNRTLYCAAMKHNNELMAKNGEKNISLLSINVEDGVDMMLEGKEYDDWKQRIKGFEITPDGELPMKNMGWFKQMLYNYNIFLRH